MAGPDWTIGIEEEYQIVDSSRERRNRGGKFPPRSGPYESGRTRLSAVSDPHSSVRCRRRRRSDRSDAAGSQLGVSSARIVYTLVRTPLAGVLRPRDQRAMKDFFIVRLFRFAEVDAAGGAGAASAGIGAASGIGADSTGAA